MSGEEVGTAETDATPGCGCLVLCSMGPTCPGGMLAGLPESGCHRQPHRIPWACLEPGCDASGETTGTEAGADAKHSRAEQHCTTTALSAEAAARMATARTVSL